MIGIVRTVVSTVYFVVISVVYIPLIVNVFVTWPEYAMVGFAIVIVGTIMIPRLMYPVL